MSVNKKIISAAILLVLVAFAAYYLKENWQDFQQIKISRPYYLIVIIGIFLVNYYFVSLVTQSLLCPLGVHLKNKESYMLSIVTGFYNLVMPFRGGMAARAVYLKKKYNFTYVNFLATLSASYVLIFLVASLLGIVSTLMIYKQSEVLSLILLLIFLTVFLGMLFIIFISPKFKERENKWLNRFIKVINGWHLIKHNKKVIAVTTIITLVQLLLSTLMLYLQFLTFGIEISFASALFLSAIGNLSIIIGITPGNLGISEAITVFSASTIGITPAESLSAALLGRAVSLVVLFVLGPIFSYVLMKKEKIIAT